MSMIYVPEYCIHTLCRRHQILFIILCTNYIKLIIIIITISKSLTQYLSNIPGKNEIKELKKEPY